MNNRTNEITSWEPLTKWQRRKMKVVNHLALINLGVWLAGAAAILTISWLRANDPGMNKMLFFLPVSVILISYFTTIASSRSILHANASLDLEDKVVVYRRGTSDGLVDMPISVTSEPIKRDEIENGSSLLPNALIKIIAPLRHGERVEIFFREDGRGEWRAFNPWRVELVEAHWGHDEKKTIFRLIDKSGQPLYSTLEQITELIQLCANGGDEVHFFSNMLVSLASNEANMRCVNRQLLAKMEQFKAGSSDVIHAILLAVDYLATKGNFPRKRKEANRVTHILLSPVFSSDALLAALPAISSQRIAYSRVYEDTREHTTKRAQV